MAKYIGTYFTSARNKLGGLVLIPTSGTPTLRHRHIPIKPQTRGHVDQQTFMRAARQAWFANPGEYTLSWMILASWLRYGDGPSSGKYTPPFPVWLSAQSNARILATTISECTNTYPDAPGSIDAVTLSLSGSTTLSATAFSGGAELTSPWVLFFTLWNPPAQTSPPAGGGSAIGGSLSGAAIDVTTALKAATGRTAAAGQRYALRAASLYAGSFVTAQSFAFIATVTS
jgi:hypothetical protein